MESIPLLAVNDSTHLAVCVQNVTKTCGTVNVLDSVHMNVPRRGIYGLLGPSGCGKTTLLNCILGLRKFNLGTVWVLGDAPSSCNIAKKTGYMPQKICLCNSLSIQESIKFFGWIVGLTTSKIEERSIFLSKLLALPDVHQRIDSLSGGQQRRVSLAIALLHEPQLLILDEPTVGLDPVLREAIWNYFADLTKINSTAIILTTHYMDEAHQADKIGLMRKGHIMYEESPNTLMKNLSSNTLDEVFYKIIVSKSSNSQNQHCRYLRFNTSLPKKRSIKCNNLKALLWKNYLWMFKNNLFMLISLLLPLFTVFAFGFTIGGDPKHLSIGVVNHETTNTNCEAVLCNSTLLSCHFLKYLDKDTISLVTLSQDEAERNVQHGNLYAAVIIKKEYTKHFKARLDNLRRPSILTIEGSTIDVISDNSIRDVSYFIKGYFYEAFEKFAKDYLRSCDIPTDVLEFPLRFLGPVHGIKRSNMTDFASAGVLMISTFFLASSLTGGIMITERQEGILDRCLVMGVNMFEILLAHVVSLLGVMIVQSLIPLPVYFLFFKITLKGSIFLVIGFTILCGFSGMWAGLAISSVFLEYKSAIFLLLGFLFPTMMISGTIWPLEGMDYYLQWASSFLPLTTPIESLRSILQKGWSIDRLSVAMGFGVLIVWTSVFMIISLVSIKFKQNQA